MEGPATQHSTVATTSSTVTERNVLRLPPQIDRSFAAVLARLHQDRERYFGTTNVVLRPLTQADRRFSKVLRVEVSKPGVSSYAFVKVYKELEEIGRAETARRRVEGDFAATLETYRGMSAAEGIGAVKPIACFPDDLAIVTEEAPGVPLAQVLRSMPWRGFDADWVNRTTQSLEAAGRWLHAFQKAGQMGRVWSLDASRQYLAVRLDRLVQNPRARFTDRNRRNVLRYFDRVAKEVSLAELSAVSIHGDFCPENILIEAARATALDFADGATGTRYHDLAYLYLYLDLLKAKPWLSARGVEHLQTGLLRGYDEAIDPHRPLFQLMLLQHLICQMVDATCSVVHPLKRAYQAFLWGRHQRWIRSL